MNNITILEKIRVEKIKENCFTYLSLEKYLVEKQFSWLTLKIIGKTLRGNGVLKIGGLQYNIEIYYSPYLPNRFDKIFITNLNLKFNHDIHIYRDMSLCLYYPKIDKHQFEIIPLCKMIPWISEWCIYYEQWKKYGIWLGKEVKHRRN